MVNYPSEWKEKKLKDVADYRNGKAHEQNVVENGKYIIVNAKFISTEGEVKKYCDEQIEPLFKDEIAIVLSDIPNGRALGKTYLINKNDKYSLNQRIAGITPHNDINSYFLAKLMNRNDYFLSFNDGINQTNLSVQNVMNFSARYPTLDEQNAVADTLLSFDKHIDNLIRLLEKKRAIRDGAMEDLVTGKNRLAGFDDEWESVSFNDVIVPKARIGWQGLKKHEYLQNGYSYLIGGTDFNNGTISTVSIWSVSKERYQMDNNIQVSTYDVLVTKDGTIGKVALVPKLNKPATLNSGVFVFKTNSKLNSKFLYRILTSSIFKDFITTLSAGSTIKHLYQKDLKNLRFKIPIDIKEQQAIAEILTAMDNEIISLEKELDKMKQIREGAMDDLLTGRIRLEV